MPSSGTAEMTKERSSRPAHTSSGLQVRRGPGGIVSMHSIGWFLCASTAENADWNMENGESATSAEVWD